MTRCTRRNPALRGEFSCQDEGAAPRVTPTRREGPAPVNRVRAKQAGPGLHLGRGLALQLSARNHHRALRLTHGYRRTDMAFILANKLNVGPDQPTQRLEGAAR